MSREKKLFFNTMILGLGTVLPKLFNFLILPILTAYLTKTQYGTYDLIITTLYFFLPIVTLQIEQASFRFLIDAETKQDKIRVVSSSTVYLFLVSVLIYVVGFFALGDFDSQIKQLILVFALANLCYAFVLQLNRGLKQLKIYSTMALTNSLLNVVFILIFVWRMKLALVGLLFSLNISILASIIVGIVLGRLGHYLKISAFEKETLKELLTYSVPLLPNAISWWVVGLSDRWIIRSFLGLEANALYAISNKLPSVLNFIYRNFNLAWQESATLAKEDEDKNVYYSSVFATLFDFLVGSILLLITLSPLFFKILIDPAYDQAFYQMPILFIAVFFGILASFYGGIYIAFKKSNEVGKSAFLAAIINIVFNLIFVKMLGLYAASLSTLVSYLVILIYRAIDMRKYVEIKYKASRISLGIGLVILISGFSYLNNFHLNIGNFLLALVIALILNKDLIQKLISQIKGKKRELLKK